jgi:uncharacterized damage-inducible protein DinB
LRDSRWNFSAGDAYTAGEEILMRRLLLCFCVVVTATVALAEDNPISAYNKHLYSQVSDILLRSADKMPEESYSFKPTEAVRSYGQILGHLADAQYLFCSAALGEKGPDLKIEQTKTSKADLIAALKAGFAYCDKAYDGLTDASAAQMVKFFGNDRPRLGVLTVNNMHNMEHYGNLVTYMRMKNIVPPSSEPPPPPAAPAPPKK